MEFKSSLFRLIPFFMCTVLVFGIASFADSIKAWGHELRINHCMLQIEENINNKMQRDPLLALSSNPYDYIKGDKAFDEMISLGPEAVPALYNRIINSENNGLQEYIYAIASEKILKISLKTISIDGYQWSNAKDWTKSYYKFSKDLEKNIAAIKDSTEEDFIKAQKIEELGIQAIPYAEDSNFERKEIKSIQTLNEYMVNLKTY